MNNCYKPSPFVSLSTSPKIEQTVTNFFFNKSTQNRLYKSIQLTLHYSLQCRDSQERNFLEY